MSATLRYLSYVRRGLARSIGELADRDGVPTSAAATIDVALTAAGEPVGRAIAVRGPGSVVGLAAGEVVRVDPPDGATGCASNLFASVELRTAELPWLFTPARPRDGRLMPWLVLIVVEEGQGATLEAGVLEVDDVPRELPPLTEAWAWAHAQVDAAYDDLATLLADTPELATARLVCPRLLEPDTGYLACVVPAFEAGRLAGLGLPPPDDPVALAWTDDSRGVRLPVLHDWGFRTAADPADFEDLVRRLEPQPLGPDVGVRDLDLSDPGSARLPHDPVVVGYEGALGSPEMRSPPWRDPEKAAFQDALGELLADVVPGEARAQGAPYVASRHDPVVGPPRYGALPSGIDDVPAPGTPRSPHTPQWLSDVNLDPKHRAAAGLGADVVQRSQETLMADAWDQARGLGQVNRLLARTRLALEVGVRAQARFAALPDGALLQATAGAHARLPGGVAGRTAKGRWADTAMPAGLVSAAFRRRARPGGLLARAVTAASADQAVVTNRMTEAYGDAPARMLAYATLTLPAGMDLSAAEVAIDGALPASPGAATPTGQRARERRRRRAPRAAPGRQIETGTRLVDSVFGAIDHVASGLGVAVLIDSELELRALAGIVRAGLEPTAVLGARLRQVVQPAGALGDAGVPASLAVTLELTDPLYRRVVAIDPELLLPGVGALPADSVGLAEVNQASLEAFLLGANRELGRELAWREYPTAPGGTWLRTFWDALEPAGDIAPVADWTPGRLGTHPGGGADPGAVLVLVVKGDLLRRYPRTLVTAVPARWRGGLREEDRSATPIDPSFTGTLGPDAVFVGFDFSGVVDDVPGGVAGSAEEADARPGWYFAFEQPPTEPAFGLDTDESDESPGLALWKDLTRADARAAPSDTHVGLAALGSRSLPYDDVGENTWSETWADSAAGMARIMLQRPVRMLVHADQMLVTPDA